MGMNLDNGSGLQSEINITPLVDVVLVLLIIFMVIVPLTLHGYDVNVPGEAVPVPQDLIHHEQVVLGIDLDLCPVRTPPAGDGLPADCRVRINDVEVALPDLAGHVAGVFQARRPEEQVLFLAADDRLNYEVVMRIVDTARSRVEALRIGIVTERAPAAAVRA